MISSDAAKPDALSSLRAAITSARGRATRPVTVALDGRSGAGKSTLAARVVAQLGGPRHVTVIDGDDFYSGGTAVLACTPAQRADRCIDWRRQRPVLEALRRGEVATWLPFDWGAFDGRLGPPVRRESCPIVLLEGVYSARPELWDLLDLRVHLAVSEPVRLQRLLAREGELGPWELQWHEAEDHYFSTVMPADRFDLALAWESESL